MGFVSTVTNLFWLGLLTVVLLIIGFFILRVAANVGKNTPVAGVVGRVQRAATPAG